MTADDRRPGFALLIVLAAILMASALVLATLFRVQSDSAIARSGTLRRIAVVAAESAIWTTVDNTDAATLRALPIGAVKTSSALDGDTTITVTLTRTDTTFVWIVADASILRGAQRARHRVGITVALARDTTRVKPLPLAGRAWVEAF
ncbi:MAG: hypothetical protein ACR2MQ_06770 [Gemmatimonadaceae bacterium]